MMLHAWAPTSAPPPEFYAQYTWVKELGLTWQDIQGRGLSRGEMNLLAQMLSLKAEADRLKEKAHGRG